MFDSKESFWTRPRWLRLSVEKPKATTTTFWNMMPTAFLRTEVPLWTCLSLTHSWLSLYGLYVKSLALHRYLHKIHNNCLSFWHIFYLKSRIFTYIMRQTLFILFGYLCVCVSFYSYVVSPICQSICSYGQFVLVNVFTAEKRCNEQGC